MKKRLRKKKHLGEFRQFGFSLECLLRVGLSDAEFDRFLDEFIADAIEARGLVFGGGGSPEKGWSGVVCRDHRYDSTTETDKTTVHDWLKSRSEVQAFRISDSWDVWHGPDPHESENAESLLSPLQPPA